MKFDLFYPVKPFTITQPYGVNGQFYRDNGINIAGHNGLDIRAPHGTPVYAAHDGLAYYEIDANQGHGVVIRTTEKFEYQYNEVFFKTIYWHLCDPASGLASPVYTYGLTRNRAPMPVKAGDIIGNADNTGFSKGSHLHFGLKPMALNENDWTWFNIEQGNGYGGTIDPTPYFNRFYASDAQKVLGLYLQLPPLLRSLYDAIKAERSA